MAEALWRGEWADFLVDRTAQLLSGHIFMA
jgi:hypothetical protein